MKHQIVGVLNGIFKKRKQRNPKYSLRSFARDLEISPGRLSRILNEKDEPGPKFIETILNTKTLGPAEREEIKRSVQNSRNPFTHIRDNDELVIEKDELQIVWSCMAIFSLLNAHRKGFSAHVIGERLGLTRDEAKECLEFLVKNKAIKVTANGEYVTATDKVLLPRKQAYELYYSHIDFLKKVFARTQEIAKGEILYGNMTLALTSESAQKVKKILISALTKITKEASSSGEKRVFHLTTQLFPVDKGR